MPAKEYPLRLAQVRSFWDLEHTYYTVRSQIKDKLDEFFFQNVSSGFNSFVEKEGHKITIFSDEVPDGFSIPLDIFVRTKTKKKLKEYWERTKSSTRSKDLKEFAKDILKEMENGHSNTDT